MVFLRATHENIIQVCILHINIMLQNLLKNQHPTELNIIGNN